MSGIEVAGLVFGILPILIEVVKSYETIAKGVRTVRHYSKEVKSISEQLNVHNGIFLNEVRLLLRSIEAEEDVEVMLSDAADRRWISKSLDDKLRSVLRDSFQICCGIIEETKDTIETLRVEMKKFDALIDQKIKGESIKSAFRRLKGAVEISFDKPRHDRCLASLRDRNGDLSALRSQIGAFQHYALGAKTCIQHRTLPIGFTSVNSASQKLHEALCGAWCCDDPAHRGHYAKLCVDVRVEEQVRLDLAISCHEPSAHGGTSSMTTPPIWFYVQSMSTSGTLGRQPVVTAASPAASSASSPLELLTSYSLNVLKKKASSDLQQQQTCRKKKKRVRFDDACDKSDHIVTMQHDQAPPPDFDLCQATNICKYLQKHHQTAARTAAKRCIGYLETPQLYRHLFYLQDRARNSTSTQDHQDNVYSLSDIMSRDPDETMEVEDQLRLALKTATALLQFNGTPWLSERWRLRDLSYFGSNTTLDNSALKTLHLSSRISSATDITAVGSTMDGVEQATEAVSDQVRYGINNTTLFFLGVALLEIAHWKPIEEKMTARDLNNEVFAARRLGAGRAPLGPQYQKIAEKCLQCNFGFGTKLSSKGLQTAVYNDVVCQLEAMIEKLTI